MVELEAEGQRLRIGEGRFVVERAAWGNRWKPVLDEPLEAVESVDVEEISPEQVGHRLIGKLPAVTALTVRFSDREELYRVKGLSVPELQHVLRPVFG